MTIIITIIPITTIIIITTRIIIIIAHFPHGSELSELY